MARGEVPGPRDRNTTMRVETQTDELAPWAPINRMLSNMRNLTVKVGGDEYRGAVAFENDEGHVTIEVPAKRKKAKKK